MAQAPTDRAEYAEYSSATRWIILLALMLGTLMQVIDTSIVNVAIPQMMGNLGATLEQIGWVSTGYIIANVIFLPLTGWLSSTFGRKRYLTASIVIFTIASFLCGTAHTLPLLIFYRILQGAGGAALLSTAQATMMQIFPPHQLGMVQAVYGIGVMVGPTVGPTLGGWITDNYSWPWVFFINIPIGIIAAILTMMFVHDSPNGKTHHGGMDFVGIGLLAIGLGSMQTVLEKGNHEGWFSSSMIVWLTISSVIALIAFVMWELKIEHPAVNLRVLKNRGFAAGTVVATVVGFGLFGGIFIIPVFLQQLRHYSAEQSGWIIFPGAMATAIIMPVVGKLVSKFPARNLVAIGAIGFIISSFAMRTITMDTGPEHLFWPLVLRGASLGFLFVPLTLATLISLKGKDMADGTGLFNVFRQIGGSAGIAFLSTLVDHRTNFHRAALIEHISVYNAATIERLNLLVKGLMSKGFALPIARQQAVTILDRTVQGQAAVMAYEDAFIVVGMLFILILPLLLLFKAGKPSQMQKPPVGE